MFRKEILAKMRRPQTAEQSRQIVDELTEIEAQQETVQRFLNEMQAKRRES